MLRPAVTHNGWLLDLTGYVQADAIAWSQESADELDPSTRAPLNQEHFAIPRASLRVDARRDQLSAELELEGFTSRATLPRRTQTSGVRLETAWVGWHRAKLVEVLGGLFRTPFGMQTPSSPRTRPFLELPTMARALFPGDIDAGVMVRGAYGLIRYSVAAMNGAPVGDAQWKGTDPTGSYDIVGRIGAEVELPYRGKIVAGVSALDGKGLHPGTAPTKDSLQWVDENQDGIVQTTELQVLPGMTGTPSQTFEHNALGADLEVHWCLCVLGTGSVFAEAVIATNLDRGLVYADPIASTRDLRHFGFAIGAVQNLGAHAQVGARYDRYDADRDANEREGVMLVGVDKVFSTISVMAAGRWHDARLMVEYDHQRNPFGRADNGMPVTRESDSLTFRAQVGF